MTTPVNVGKLGPRYDKYQGDDGGGFRARVAEAWTSTEVGKIFGVSINSAGKVVRGGAATAIVGIVIVQGPKAINDVVDVMRMGEVADVLTLNDGTTATTAGTVYYADATTGAITATATSNKRIGQMLEKDGRDRLLVWVAQG